MAKIQRGFLLIADITGYTAYLHGSELEHAEDSLRSLLNLLIEQTRLPQVISKLEGDAVFSYALESSFLQGQTLVEMIENTYLAFRQALELMIINTTCTCNACRNLGSLDLKIFVHYGTFILQKFPTYTELVSDDVVLIHRLTKNSVVETTGVKAYALYTRAALDRLGMQEELGQMISHRERYDHIGEVDVFVRDMHTLWDEEKGRVRTSVQTEDAALIVEGHFPVPLSLMWDYVTKPEYMAILTNSTSALIENLKYGRIGKEATYHCAHGDSAINLTIVDWQPPVEHTVIGDPILGCTFFKTIRLFAEGENVRVQILYSEFSGGLAPVRILLKIGLGAIAKREDQRAMQNLHQRIEEEIAEGKVILPTKNVTPTEEMIGKEVAEELNQI